MSEKIYIPNDDDQVREMIGLYEDGMSYSEIGNLYGIKPQKVGYIFSKIKGFKARKYTASKRFRAASDAKRKLLDEKLLKQLYVDERLSTIKIATFLGENYDLIRSNLLYYNIPIRPIENYTTSELTHELLKQLYIDENMTAQQIGDKLGYSVLTIRKRLHKFGIKKRKIKDSKSSETQWFTTPDLSREYQIPLSVIWRLIRQRIFPHARRETSSGSNYWVVPTIDIENYRVQLKALAQENTSDPRAIIQFRYGYGADEILEIIEFERQNFSRDEIAAIFRIDRILLDRLLDSSASGIARQKKPAIKRLPKKLLIDLHLEQKLGVEEILVRLNTTYLPFYLSLRDWGIPLNIPTTKAHRPAPLTARRKAMIELYESGLSLSEVGDKFGIRDSTVCTIFKKAGYQTRRYTMSNRAKTAAGKKIKVIEKDLLVKHYVDEKLSIKKVADVINETVWRVRQNLISHNIPIRPKPDRTTSKLTETLLKRLFVKEKLTAKEIAARLDYSPKTINKKLRRFGIRNGQNKYIRIKNDIDKE